MIPVDEFSVKAKSVTGNGIKYLVLNSVGIQLFTKIKNLVTGCNEVLSKELKVSVHPPSYCFRNTSEGRAGRTPGGCHGVIPAVGSFLIFAGSENWV